MAVLPIIVQDAVTLLLFSNKISAPFRLWFESAPPLLPSSIGKLCGTFSNLFLLIIVHISNVCVFMALAQTLTGCNKQQYTHIAVERNGTMHPIRMLARCKLASFHLLSIFVFRIRHIPASARSHTASLQVGRCASHKSWLGPQRAPWVRPPCAHRARRTKSAI